MEFSEEFFQDEVIDGFYVSSLIKRAWAAQLEVLEDVDRVCKKHNIRYFAEWGTLLGTVRHGGFIPWDDDLDICMLREDYEKFNKVAPSELPSVYNVYNFDNMDEGDVQFDDYLTRVHSGFDIRTDDEYLEKFHGFPFIAGIDIFPLDFLPRGEKDQENYRNQLILLNTMAKHLETWDDKEKEEKIRGVEQIYGVKIDRKKSYRKQLFQLAARMNGMFKSREADYITSAALFTEGDYKLPKKAYMDVIYMPFQGFNLPVPVGYDSILKYKYGDYMKSVRSGGGHDYPFYKKQIAFCEGVNVGLFNEYKFNERELFRKNTDDTVSLKELTKNIINLLHEANDMIDNAVDSDDWNTVLVLLEDCQDGAVALGENIEKVKGEATKTVASLEHYCEILYTLHEEILTNGGIEKEILSSNLYEIVSVISMQAEKEIIFRKEIVFMPYRSVYWNALESVWEAAMADSNTDVYVVPIPYYEKDFIGLFGNAHYDGDQYPEYVKIEDYKTFDFGLHHPDIIVFQNPYDEYNGAISVQPFFYAKNIKEYTDKLVYIPFFLMDEIEEKDERGYSTLQYCCTVPGVVNADLIIVQSEQMKNSYVKALTEFAGEDTRELWESKIVGIGSPIVDAINEQKAHVEIPDEWKGYILKADKSKKKVVFYYVSSASVLENQEKALKKIANVLQIFKEQKDNITLIWRQDNEMKKRVATISKSLLQKYEEIESTFVQEDWGVLDCSEDVLKTIDLCDAYYGDTSDLVKEFKRDKRPIMIQNVDII